MKLLCTAGISYCLIYPNGDVYRCMADYNARRPPMGNMRDGRLRLFSQPKLCTHPRCYAACDIDWATKWLVDDAGKTVEKIPAQETGDLIPIPGEQWSQQELPDQILRDSVVIVWAPTLICNYDCIYCGCAAGVHDIPTVFPSAAGELTTQQWLDGFRRITAQFEWGILRVTGGEPFLSQALLPVVQQASDKFLVNISSNMSRDLLPLRRMGIRPYDPQSRTGVYFTASLHPSARQFRFDQFFGRVLFLKESGFPVLVNFVAYPEQMALIDYYRDIFNRYEVEVDFSPWCGADNKGRSGYTSEEQQFVELKTNPWRSSSKQISLSDLVFNNAYVAELTSDEVLEGIASQAKPVRVRVTNRGSRTWISHDNDPDVAQVLLGCRVYAADRLDKPPVYEGRSALPHDVRPGQSFDGELQLMPADKPPGEYLAVIDLVCERNFWFADFGSPARRVLFELEGAAAERGVA